MAKFWEKITNFFQDNVWNVLEFLGVLLIGIVLISILMSIIRHICKKKNAEPVLTRFVINVIRFLLYLILVLVLLSVCGFNITALTTAISALVLAIGMALKENIAAVANGIILVGSRKYKQGDYIVVAGVEGSVVDINFLFTTLKTPDGKQVTLPNSTMVNNPVTNFNAYDKRRVSYEIGVAYESDTELVKKIVLDCINACGLTLKDPAPNCRLKILGDSSIVFFVTFFVDTPDYWDAYYEVLGLIFNEFKRNNISIPYQQIEVRERKDEVVMPVVGEYLPQRVEKQRPKKKKSKSLEDLEDFVPNYFEKKKKKNNKNSKK